MTISKTVIFIVVAILLVGILFGGYELVQEHDARLKAEGAQAVQAQVISAAQTTINQAKADQAKTDSDLKAQLSSIANQRTVVITPQQAAAAIPTIIHDLPMPVQVQTVPATATAQTTQQIVIPQADIPAFQKYKLDCDESSAKLTACTLNAASTAIEQTAAATQLKAVTTERDAWKTTAKGGTWWHRTVTSAKWIAIGGATGYIAGRYGK